MAGENESRGVPRLRRFQRINGVTSPLRRFVKRSPRERLTLSGSKGRVPNVLATMLHHPALAASFNRFGNVLLTEPAIGHRGRELMLLRVAWRTRARYEWVHHVRLAKTYGLGAHDVAVDRPGRLGIVVTAGA